MVVVLWRTEPRPVLETSRTLSLIRGSGKGWLRTPSEPGLEGRIDLRGKDQQRGGEEA